MLPQSWDAYFSMNILATLNKKNLTPYLIITLPHTLIIALPHTYPNHNLTPYPNHNLTPCPNHKHKVN
jgi:hypothetical protein